MLMDILDSETAIGLNEEELLGTCETVTSTVQESKVPMMAIGRKDFTNTTSLAETVDFMRAATAEVNEVPPMVCKITMDDTRYFDIRADKIVPMNDIPACKIAGTLEHPACETAGTTQPAVR